MLPQQQQPNNNPNPCQRCTRERRSNCPHSVEVDTADDAPSTACLDAYNAALDDVETAILHQRITAAALFRIYADAGFIRRRRFFEAAQQFSKN